MEADHVSATTNRPECHAVTSLDVQSLLERIAFLEEQIAELRRASMIEKARLAARGSQDLLHLREIESSRGYRLLRRYYALADTPVTGPVIHLLRRLARSIPHLVKRLRAAS